MRNLILILFLFIASIHLISAQNTAVEGYIFEDGNRGYLNQVIVNIFSAETDEFLVSARTNKEGFFTVDLPINNSFKLVANKDVFEETIHNFKTSAEEKLFLKLPMKREEGYIFEVTLAPKRESEDIVVDAITGALIEVYNNTTKKEELVLENHSSPDFKIQFKKGNHYTVMVRKEGYLVKRMEAFVNVDGCILCFEGVGEVKPGVTENLTEKMSMGTLLANVEMDPLYEGKIIELQNIYYDFGKATLTKQAKEELKKLASIIKDNPQLNVELGSHTDVRGTGPDNRLLSEKRAQSAVGFLTQELKVDEDRIIAKGYGESLIKNKCRPGVTCTDAEHAENRRTEIKILKVKDNGLPLTSLASMIFEEEFMRKLLEGDVEQVNYKEVDKGVDGKEVDKRVDEKVEEGVDDIEVEKMVEEDEMKVGDEKKEVDEVEMKVEEEIIDEKAKEVSANKKKGATLIVAQKKVEKKKEKKLTLVKEKEIKTSKAKANTEVNVDEKIQSGFSGYRIVIYFSSIPLSGDHEIFSKFNDIETYRTPEKNFLYMIGEFKNQSEAELFRTESINEEYPGSYVVAFLYGKRIKIN